MNFEEIKKKYPEAWDKFHIWLWESMGLPPDEKLPDLINDRFESLSGWLFNFFDEQGIVIVLDLDEKNQYKTWLFEISDNGHWEHIEYGFQTRPEAKQASFTKAFEILEQKK